HDGDNFLGGRDMDAAVVARVLEELERGGHRIDRADPRHAPGLRRLRHAAEEAKLDLAREREVAISVPAAFVLDSGPVDVDTWLDRDALDALALPLVDRSLQICLRLLASRGLGPDDLDRVVLVGGPTVMPVLRGRVATLLDSELLDGVDPMTLVARGAALFAATAGIDGRPSEAAIPRAGPRVWLQHPAVTSDPSPYVVGKVLDGPSVTSVRIERTDGSWAGEPSAVDDDRAFCVPVSLHLRKATDFRLHGVDAGGALVHVQPDQFRIVHGLTVTDPPLARSIGVALADDTVQIYLERGTPLPMRRTFVHHTVETVAKGDSELLLHVPIVQGEVPVAHLCRLVGSLQVSGAALKGTLPAGSPVEITLELDRGGRLEARAFVPDLEQSFDQVAWLIVPRLSPDALAESLVDLRTRASTLQSQAFGRHEAASIARLEEVSRLLTLAEGDLELARGGDADAGEKARRIAIEVEELLWEQEVEGTWPELADRLERRVHWASSWLAQYGSDMERSTFASMVERARELLTARRAADLERSLAQINRLGAACYFRSPGAWEEQFDRCASRVSEAIDLPRAQSLVNEGRAALERGDEQAVERIVNALWRLMPPDAEDRQLGHDSGLR
ncbi:MAG: Hsp70 family protein, partial [Myxococcota bacterium]